jgi:periplasmic protein CpxP/Spy
MSKTRFLILAIVVLFLINIMTLAFFTLKGPRGKDRKPPKEYIAKKLHFDDKQIIEYDILIDEHQSKIRKLDEELKRCKNDLYSQLSKPANQKVTDSLFTQLALTQKNIEQSHYHHFLEIKALCTDKQLEDFNQLTKELAKLFGPKPPKRDRNQRE